MKSNNEENHLIAGAARPTLREKFCAEAGNFLSQ